MLKAGLEPARDFSQGILSFLIFNTLQHITNYNNVIIKTFEGDHLIAMNCNISPFIVQ